MENTDIEQVCVVVWAFSNPIGLINLSEAGKLKTPLQIKASLTASLAATTSI
jgi:hypothetical protein